LRHFATKKRKKTTPRRKIGSTTVERRNQTGFKVFKRVGTRFPALDSKNQKSADATADALSFRNA
jgi:hypothetical protein